MSTFKFFDCFLELLFLKLIFNYSLFILFVVVYFRDKNKIARFYMFFNLNLDNQNRIQKRNFTIFFLFFKKLSLMRFLGQNLSLK